MIKRQGLEQKVTYNLVPLDLEEVAEPSAHPYADAIAGFPPKSFDWILVDGMVRLTCFRNALDKLKPGGLLILDNANRYVPNAWDGRHSTVHEPRDKPRTAGWADAMNQIAPWRAILTSDGIWDTRFWQKPM